MVVSEKILSPQEQRIAEGRLVDAESGIAGTRVERLLQRIVDKPPRVSLDRARLYTESFKQTEGLPLEIRVAKALENIMSKIEVSIGDEELIVGHCGGLGQHGLLYPEIQAGWFKEHVGKLPTRQEGRFSVAEEDIRVINEEIVPYWKGKTIREAYENALPESTLRALYKEDNYTQRGLMDDIATIKAMNDWVPDHEKVLRKGFNGIKREAEERLASLDVSDPENSLNKMPFLKAVIIVCDAMVTYARRYAELARRMAEEETDDQRKRELLEIAEICEWVPGNPARTFREAIQSLWFNRVGFCFEQEGAAVGNGRIDQYMYPYYERDMKEGRITEKSALELLECLWIKMAQYRRLIIRGGISTLAGYAHWEQTTLGGQTRDGEDATNELSYLILQSKIDFPLDYPDLMVRVHARSPQAFLMKACECVKQGTGFPKFQNDEEIVPLLVSKGVPWEEARDYCGSGCAEARVPNLDVYSYSEAFMSMGAALEMALNDGVLRLTKERLGVRTGDPRDFTTFDDVMNAFRLQIENITKHTWIKATMIDTVRPKILAAPLHSCLNDLFMQQCVDIHSGKVQGGLRNAGKTNYCGFGTTVDSLAAIKKLVYDDKTVTMTELLEGLEANFEGKEALRQMCLNTPKYGNNDPYVDSIGREVQRMLVTLTHGYTDAYGIKHDLQFVPVAAHVTLGAALGATPNGRRAKEALSDGVSPSQGSDVNGPTAALLSVANVKDVRYEDRGATLLNMKFSPQAVAGEEGTRNLVSLLRTWCDLKIWHIQFNIINAETLRDAQKNPEKYRSLLVRVAGYSAYFVDLSPALQEDIVRRMEHQYVG